MSHATALIAEDEPVLADALQRHLRQLWPALQVVAQVGDGLRAVESALQHLPDMLFLDIHMPGLGGMDVAEQVAEQWPLDRPLPLLCFVTAYDHYAVSAFEKAAVDYVLKPVRPERLALTCARLQQQLALRQSPATALNDPPWPSHWPQLQASLQAPQAEPPLRILQALSGQSLFMVDVAEVLYLEAADKYVRVVTRQPPPGVQELLIRTPLKELLPRLAADQFWQIHRSVVVNAHAIERVSRQQQRLRVHLRQHPDVLDVSRMHAHLFKAL